MLQRKFKPSKYSLQCPFNLMSCQMELAGKILTKQLMSRFSHSLKLKSLTDKVSLQQRVVSVSFSVFLLSSLLKILLLHWQSQGCQKTIDYFTCWFGVRAPFLFADGACFWGEPHSNIWKFSEGEDFLLPFSSIAKATHPQRVLQRDWMVLFIWNKGTINRNI